MARRKKKRGTISGYFPPLFAEHPEWLKETSNDVILARYRSELRQPTTLWEGLGRLRRGEELDRSTRAIRCSAVVRGTRAQAPAGLRAQ